MKQFIYFIFILLGLMFVLTEKSNAQQKLTFFNIRTGLERTYMLPLIVECSFKDNSSQTLIIERISRDSLFFKKYYNAPSYDCNISEIRKIRIKRDLNFIRDISLAGAYGFSSFIYGVSTVMALSPSVFNSEYSLWPVITFGGIPFSMGSILLTRKIQLKTQNTFRLNENKISFK